MIENYNLTRGHLGAPNIHNNEDIKMNNINIEKLTREQAIELVGINNVEAVESENCDYDSIDEFGTTQWSSYIELDDPIEFDEWEYHGIAAYYFVEQEDLDECEQLDEIDWKISYYSLVR